MRKRWIKIQYAILEWVWFQSAETLLFFIYCLLRANYVVAKWLGIDVARGQFVSSLLHMSQDTHLSVRKIRTAIKRLKSTGDLSCEATNKYTLITVCKYDEMQGAYGSDRQSGRQVDRQTEDKQMSLSNKKKNNKKDMDLKFKTDEQYECF